MTRAFDMYRSIVTHRRLKEQWARKPVVKAAVTKHYPHWLPKKCSFFFRLCACLFHSAFCRRRKPSFVTSFLRLHCYLTANIITKNVFQNACRLLMNRSQDNPWEQKILLGSFGSEHTVST